ALRRGERREARLAAQAARGAGEDHRAVPARQHAPRRLACDQEAAGAALPPAALEILEARLGEWRLHASRGDECHGVDRPELLFHALVKRDDLALVGEIREKSARADLVR